MKIKIIGTLLLLICGQQHAWLNQYFIKSSLYEKFQYIIACFSKKKSVGYLTTNKKQNKNPIPSLPNEYTNLKINRDELRNFLDNEFQKAGVKTLYELKIIKKLFQLLDNNGSETEISRCFNILLDRHLEIQWNEADLLFMDICDQYIPQNKYCMERKRIIEHNKNYHKAWYQKVYGIPLQEIKQDK